MIPVAFNNFGFEHLPAAANYAHQGVAGWARAAADHGFRYYQYTISGPQDPDRFSKIDVTSLAKQLRRTDVTLSLHHHAFDLLTLYHFAARDAYALEFQLFVKAALDFVQAVGGNLVTIHPPQINVGRDERGGYADLTTRKRAITVFRDALMDLGEYADLRNMRLGIEAICFPDPFPGGTAFRGSRELDDFLSSGSFPSSVGILLDTTHFHHKGLDVGDHLRLWQDYLFDVHISDSIVHDWVNAAEYRERFLDEVHLPIGQGTTDFPALVQTLRAIEYTGWLTLEIYPRHVRSMEDICHSRVLLEQLLKE